MRRMITGGVCALYCGIAAAGGGALDSRLERIAGGLDRPLAARHAGDGSGRLFVVQQSGLIRIIDRFGRLAPTPFLDLSPETGLGLTTCGTTTANCGERGLLGLDFHPQYETNGLFYVNYTNLAGDTVVGRYQVDPGDPNLADPASGLILIAIDQDFGNHNGGDIHFGPDGYLYVGMGDGGSGGDPNDRAQDPTTLLGKMLRIDVDNPGANGANACGPAANYGIPADNPFLGDDGVCDEIWASGLRNPFRFSFDAATGDLFIGDVGQHQWEEVSFQPAASPGGENYGWDCREGAHDYSGPPDAPALSCAAPPVVTDPILEYFHQNGRCSVAGGYRYRGPYQNAVGLYFYGDFCAGDIFTGAEALGVWTPTLLPRPYRDQDGNTVNPNVSAFGEDEDLNLYVVDLGGNVYRYGQLISANGFED